MDDTIFRKLRSKQGEVWQLDRHEAPFWTTPDKGGQPCVAKSLWSLGARKEALHRRRPFPGRACLVRDVWTDTPGALEWLQAQSAASAAASQAWKSDGRAT